MGKKNCTYIQELRVRMWLETALRASGMRNLRQLEFHLSPDTNISNPNNAWYRYQNGKSFPRRRRVDFLDEKYSGISKVLNHGLWQLLEQKDVDIFLINKIIESFDHTYVQDLLKTCLSPHFHPKSVEKIFKFLLPILYKLLKTDSLDALTALVLYWKVAHQNNNTNNIYLTAKLIYRFLLMMSINICPAILQKLFFEVFKKHVFDKSKKNLGRCVTYSKAFMMSRRMLQYATYLENSLDDRLTMYQLLKSKYYNFGLGLDIVFDFSNCSVLPIYTSEVAYLNHCNERAKKFSCLQDQYEMVSPKEFKYGCDYVKQLHDYKNDE
jgi:hypothetical protein